MSFDDKFGNLFLSYLYELDAHLDRFLRSAAKAKITPPVDQAAMREILLQTAAAAHCRDGMLRYWLSCGRGGFELSTKGCDQATFYAIVLDENHVNDKFDCGVKVLQPFIYLCAVWYMAERECEIGQCFFFPASIHFIPPFCLFVFTLPHFPCTGV